MILEFIVEERQVRACYERGIIRLFGKNFPSEITANAYIRKPCLNTVCKEVLLVCFCSLRYPASEQRAIR
jgi:hypothetical protein